MDGVSLDSNGVEETYDESYVNLHPSVFRVGDNTISLGYPTSYLITEVVFDNPEISGGRGREYYGGEHGGDYLICTWKDGTKNGEGILYNMYGEIQFRGTFVNDYVEGDGYIFKDGVIAIKGKYHHSKMISTCYIECTPDYIMMVDKNNLGHFAYRGGFNEEFYEREGYGAEYENGILCHYGLYEGNVLLQILKRFQNGTMQELDENEHLVYFGQYRDNIALGFPREGEGREFKDGILVFRGTYVNGKRNGPGTVYYEHGVAKLKGIWKDGELVESHEIDTLGYYKDVSFDGRSHSFIRIVDGIETFSTQVNHIKLSNGMCNEENMVQLDLKDIQQLITVEFGNKCFMNVKHVLFNNLARLQSIKIGDDCFAFCDRQNDKPYDRSNRERCLKDKNSCEICNCRRLVSIEFGPGTCSSFCIFSLDRLDSLRTLRIGNAIDEVVPNEVCSFSFFWATDFTLVGLKSLKTVEIGCKAFVNVNNVILDSKKEEQESSVELPSLTSFNCGSWGLSGLKQGPDGPLQVTFEGNTVSDM